MRSLDGHLLLWSCLASCWYPNNTSDLFEAPLCVCVCLSLCLFPWWILRSGLHPPGMKQSQWWSQMWISINKDLLHNHVTLHLRVIPPDWAWKAHGDTCRRICVSLSLFWLCVCVCGDVCGVYTYVCVRWCVWCVHICVCALIHGSSEARGGCHESCSITLEVTSLRGGSLTETEARLVASKSQAVSYLWSPTPTPKVMGSQLNPFLF